MELKRELQQFLERNQWEWKEADENNLTVKQCPFCQSDNWKFSIHKQTTQYRCWRASCDERGNLRKLRRSLGAPKPPQPKPKANVKSPFKKKQKPLKDQDLADKCHANLGRSKKARDYLAARGLSKKTINHFNLGVRQLSGKLWITIPLYEDGQLVNIKHRRIGDSEDKNDRFRRIKGAKTVLFNGDVIDMYHDIVVCESEIDAMSLWQAGVHNVVGLSAGAGHFSNEWYDQLITKRKITLVLDADEAGQKAARDIARRLGLDKCYNVLLPQDTDPNEILTTEGAEVLVEALEEEELFEIAGVISARDLFSICRDQSEEAREEGLLTPWEGVNKLISPGWQPGDFVILSARPKIGKTSWALQLCTHFALQDIPALMYCLEMRTYRLAEKVVANIRQVNYKSIQRHDWTVARYHLRESPLHMVEPDWSSDFSADVVFDKIRDAVKRYGIRFVVFDHLHFLCRSLANVTTEIGNITRRFKMLAEELEVVLMLIAQPKKVPGGKPIDADDIKDSSSIPADADHIIVLHRDVRPAGLDGAGISDHEVLDPKTLVRLDRARFAAGGETYLHYDGALATHRSMS